MKKGRGQGLVMSIGWTTNCQRKRCYSAWS